MDWKTAEASLRRIVWEWGPIGMADFAPRDEYDCMLLPLLGKLSTGADRSEIRDFLRHEMGAPLRNQYP